MGCSCRGIIRFMTIRAFEGLVAVLILLLIPNLPPHCKIEKPYKVTPTRPLEGALALNDKLNNAELWHNGDFKGPEAFAVYNNELYTSLQSGEIVKLTGKDHVTPVVQFGKPCKHEFDEKICGRPLGIVFDKHGYLYAADAYYGIFKVNVKTGDYEQLVSPDQEINGKKPMLFNSLAISSSGDIYWTDSSTEFFLENGMFDMFSDGSGRLVHYNPKTKENKELLTNLHFANGVLLSKEEDYLLVSETVRSRIHRYYLKGPKAGTSDIFIDGLPGVTDNISHDGQGGYFIPLVSSHDANHPSPFQIFGPFPLARKLIVRIMGGVEWIFSTIDRIYPNDFARTGVYFIGHFSAGEILALSSRSTIVRVDRNGIITGSLHSTNGRLNTVSEAIIYKDHLLLGSPFRGYIGRVPLKDIGLQASSHVPEVTREKREVPVVKETPKPKPTTQAPTTKTPPTQAPKATTPPKQQTPKPQPTTGSPTQPPKVSQQPRTETPKPETKTPPPTQAPKPKTPPPTQAPKTPPPTQAPKTPTPTKAPKTPPPTQASKGKTPSPSAEAPKPKTASPTQSPKPQATTKPASKPAAKTQSTTEAPKQTTKAPKPQTPPPTQVPKQQKPVKTTTDIPSTKQSSQTEKVKT